MTRIGLVVFIIAAAALFLTPAYAETAYYVQSAKAKVMSAPSFKASVLGEASRGTKLSGIAKEGRWIKVSYYGKTGYVATLLVTSYPPLAMKGLIKAEDTDFQQSVRRRASTYTSAAAARGLAQDDRRRISGQEKTDYDGLASVEAFAVSDEELAKFMEGGKL
jgi:uncharacterized protein YgiM (DUF1202 family)